MVMFVKSLLWRVCMKKAVYGIVFLCFIFLITGCPGSLRDPFPENDKALLGSWSNYSTETMEGDFFIFHSDNTYIYTDYRGWKDKDAGEYNRLIEEGIWSTKEGSLRLSKEIFDQNYSISVKDDAKTYLLINKTEYEKL